MFKHKIAAAYFSAVTLVASSFAVMLSHAADAPPKQLNAKTDAESLQRSFEENPWNLHAETQAKRKNAFVAFDSLQLNFSRDEWESYKALRSGSDEEKARSVEMEKASPFLTFMRQRLKNLAPRLKALPLTDQQFAVAYVYNHGFLIRAEETLIAIDIAAPMVEEMADSLDALIVSHWHQDHWDAALLSGMLSRRKPVYAPGYAGSPQQARIGSKGGSILIPDDDMPYAHGPIKVSFHRGDHYPKSYVKFNSKISVSEKGVLDSVIEISLPRMAPIVILHDGDDFNKQSKVSATKGRQVDLFLGHGVPNPRLWRLGTKTQAWKDLNESIGDPFGTALEIKPHFFIAGHAAERGHGNNVGGCTPFKDAVEFCEDLRTESKGTTEAATLIWGEILVFSRRADGSLASSALKKIP